ncbi:MAG: acyl-CoA reductase, partial [Dehalococcoidales bacterium]|nr:acyl-CoA reductase [Dehalococcoidales bacterium]
MEKKAKELNLFHNNDGVIRVPFLVKGTIIAPPEMDREQIEAAFKETDRDTLYLKLPGAQLIREPVIDRRALKYTGEYLYQIMPPVDGRELIETDMDKLAQGLYALTVEDILDYLDSLSSVLGRNRTLLADLCETCRLTTGYPEAFLEAWFASLSGSLDRETARAMINNELSLWGRPGSDFLNGWVESPSCVMPGTTFCLAQRVFGEGRINLQPPDRSLVRAMPTRQLHITAGNAPDVPVISALRAILTKSAAVIKLPSGAIPTGSLLALAAAAAEPDHPLTRNLSVV